MQATHDNTGHFIVFSMITNIYNKKTKGPTLMELITATGKLFLFIHFILLFFIYETRDVRCVHRGWHGTNRYDIQVLATHTSTYVYQYFSLLQWSVAFRSARSCGSGGTNTQSLTYPQRKKSQGVMSGDFGDHSFSGWSFPDAHSIQHPGNMFTYWWTSQWKWAGLPSCWNMNISMFCNCGISHSCNMSRYVMPVTVSSALFDWWLHKTHWLYESHVDSPHRHVGFQIPIFWHCDSWLHHWCGMSLHHWTAPFPGNDQWNSLSLVTVNRNQAGTCDLHLTIVVPFGCGMV